MMILSPVKTTLMLQLLGEQYGVYGRLKFGHDSIQIC